MILDLNSLVNDYNERHNIDLNRTTEIEPEPIDYGFTENERVSIDLGAIFSRDVEVEKNKNRKSSALTDSEDMSYEKVMEGISDLTQFSQYNVSDKKSAQYNLLNSLYKTQQREGIYYIDNNKLYEEKIFKNVGTVIQQKSFVELVDNVSEELYQQMHSGDVHQLNLFKNARFTEDIVYIKDTLMKIVINNPFVFTEGDLKYMGMFQPTMIIEIELKDTNWININDNSILEFERLDIFTTNLLDNHLLAEINDKLNGITFREFVILYKSWFLVGDSNSLINNDMVKDMEVELMKTNNFDWGGYFNNEFFTRPI